MFEAHVKQCRPKSSTTKRRPTEDPVIRPFPEWAAKRLRSGNSVRIELGRPIPSQNRFMGKSHHTYDSEARAWKQHLAVHLAEFVMVKLQWSVWGLTRVIHPGSKVYDLANLVGGAKPIPDALTFHGVIVDDAPDYFTCDYAQIQADASTPVGVHGYLDLVSVAR
jgi:hypothetical protein